MPFVDNVFRSACLISAFLVSLGMGISPAEAQVKDLLGQGEGLLGQSSSQEPEFEFQLVPRDAQPGDEVRLNVTAKLPPDHYTYSTQGSFGGRTKITVEEAQGAAPVSSRFEPDHPPKKEFDPTFKQELEKFYDQVTWSRTYRIEEDATREDVQLSGKVEGQVCGDGACRPLIPPVEFRVSLVEGQQQPSSSKDASADKNPTESHPFVYKKQPVRQRGDKEKSDPIHWEIALAPENPQPGDEVTLSLTARVEEGWHVFALSQNPDMAGKPTVISLDQVHGLKPLQDAFQPGEKPETERPLESIVQKVHYGEITWTRKFEALSDVKTSGMGVSGQVRYQICNESSCLPGLNVPFTLGTVPQNAADGNPGNQQASEEQTEEAENATAADKDIRAQGLVPFLVAAFLAGFAALLTPCVFPMIPITVSFFLKQSESEHHRPVSMALIYSLGIIVTFTVLGLLMAVLFGATSINKLANNPWLNLAIAGVLIFFGMNLLGLFEIRVPGWLLTWTSGKEGQGGIVGVLFMALTFTLVSFTCTFAFAGALLVWAANGDFYWPILGMISFSTAFSLPFFFLALFPSFLQKLPKSGGWMNTVKVTMGMIEVGAAFKFLSVADLAWNPTPVFFDYSLVMASWMVLAGCTGLYLLGQFRLPHDTPTESISVPRLAFALFFLGFAGYLAVGLLSTEEPQGKVWKQIASFAPMRIEGGEGGDLGPVLEHNGLQYALDYDRAVEVAQAKNQPLFLDFTGVNCVNCRLMEKRMEESHNHKRLQKFVRVQLYTDNVPTVSDPNLVQELLKQNRSLQQDWFGDVTLPSYAVVTPNGKQVLAKFKGLEQQEGQFARFLDKGFRKWRNSQSTGKAAELARR